MNQPSAEKKERQRHRGKTTSDLDAALHRVQKRDTKITIASVAKEAGVSPALIHNRYPDFAEKIRGMTGKATRAQRDTKHDLLMAERNKNRQLREENERLQKELRNLASKNESLRAQLRLQGAIASGKVTVLDHRNEG